jgi:PTS system N-acetylglucosamine-specific IIC component
MSFTYHSIVSSDAPEDSKFCWPLPAPVSGEIMPLNQANSPLIKQRLLGDGVLVKLSSDRILCPALATITHIDLAGAQIGLRCHNGLHIRLLLHIGKLIPRPDKLHIKVTLGQSVAPGQLLAIWDILWVKRQGEDAVAAITIPNRDKLSTLVSTPGTRVMAMSDPLFTCFA